MAAKASDRLGRRKPFVIPSAAIFAAGLGQGAYFAVDIAPVLPAPANPAKDLGLMNIANNLPGAAAARWARC